MPVWAKIIFAVLVVALGAVIGVGLPNTLDGQDQVQTVAAVKKPASPAPVPIRETKTAVPDLPPASAGFNHPRPHRQSRGDKGAAASSFASLQQSIGGEFGVAWAPLGSAPTQTYGEFQVGHAWSSMKVPILVTLMREGALSPEEEAWASSAVTASDNEAAAALFQQLEDAHGGLVGGSLAVQHTLAAAGDPTTQIAPAPPPAGAVSTWGQTEWSLSGSTGFYRALACGGLLDSVQGAYVLGLMESVIPEQ